MLKSILAAAAIGATMFVGSAAPSSALPALGKATAATGLTTQVHFYRGFHRFHGFRHGFGRPFVVGGPVYYYGWGGGCGWLRSRAGPARRRPDPGRRTSPPGLSATARSWSAPNQGRSSRPALP